MKIFYNNNQRLVWIVAGVLALIVAIVIYYGSPMKAKRALINNERVITEKPVARTVESTNAFSGRMATSTGQSVAFVGGPNVVIEDGITVKEAFVVAEPDAQQWSTDAKLVYVRSLGTVTLGGVSSGWEVAFGSKDKKSGYVVSVVNGKIAQKSEIIASPNGYDIPVNWFDSGEAIKSIQASAVFKNSTISGLNFYYNEDSKRWAYAISTSKGVVPIPVR